MWSFMIERRSSGGSLVRIESARPLRSTWGFPAATGVSSWAMVVGRVSSWVPIGSFWETDVCIWAEKVFSAAEVGFFAVERVFFLMPVGFLGAEEVFC